MKFLVLFACALAVTSAGHIVAPIAHVYTAPQHLPVIGADGVPVDTAEVQHARAAHSVHKADAIARNGDYIHAAYYAHATPVVASAYAYPTAAVYPSAVNGVPLETPEVVAAKTHHFAAHAEALARNAHGVHHHLARRGIYAASPLAYSYHGYQAQHLPIIGADGVPVDTAEVQHAKAAHAVHKADAIARNGDYVHAAYYAHATPVVAAHAVPAYVAPQAYPTTAVHPVAINGVPVETPEVVAAKSHHFAAHAEALARNAHGVHHHLARRGIYAVSPLAYSYHGYQAQHLPIIGADGVPVDTAEVQHARAAHSVHKAVAHARNGDYAYAHAPVVATSYAHAPFVAAHSYAAPWAY